MLAAMLVLLLDLGPAGTACGTERWDVKVAADAAASRVSLAPHRTSIAALNALPKGCSGPQERREGVEERVFEVQGRIAWKAQERDGDWHVVLKDGVGNTIIVESPASRCVEASRFRARIRAARAIVDSWRLGQVVTVQGIGFYDRAHGQRGMSRSCLELHPVLSAQ